MVQNETFQIFFLSFQVLMLLINLIQNQESNKKLLIDAKAPSKLESIYSRKFTSVVQKYIFFVKQTWFFFLGEESAVEALIAQFYHWEGCAKLAEKKTNAILDGEKDGEDNPIPKSNEEFIEETVAKCKWFSWNKRSICSNTFCISDIWQK